MNLQLNAAVLLAVDLFAVPRVLPTACQSTGSLRPPPTWHELMQKASILDPYPLPYLPLAMIRNMIYV